MRVLRFRVGVRNMQVSTRYTTGKHASRWVLSVSVHICTRETRRNIVQSMDITSQYVQPGNVCPAGALRYGRASRYVPPASAVHVECTLCV
jgi:hypothetical protein